MKQGYLKRIGLLCLSACLIGMAGCGKAEAQETEEKPKLQQVSYKIYNQKEKGQNKLKLK